MQPFPYVNFLTGQLMHGPHEDGRTLIHHGLESANRTEREDLRHMGFQVFVKCRISRREDSVEGLAFVSGAKGDIEIALNEK